MEALFVLLLIVAALALLAVGAVAWGVDSRNEIEDDHQRAGMGVR